MPFSSQIILLALVILHHNVANGQKGGGKSGNAGSKPTVPKNTCIAKTNANAWLSIGCVVDTPTATTVDDLGNKLPAAGHSACTVDCPKEGQGFVVTAPKNICVAKTESAWLNIGCVVTTPTATTVAYLGAQSPATGYSSCVITCPIQGQDFVAVSEPEFTCNAKSGANAWANLGCVVDNPTATKVTDLGTLSVTTGYTKCMVTCPVDKKDFIVVAVQSPWRANSIGPSKISCETFADCVDTPYYSACENKACVLQVRTSTFGAFNPHEVAAAIGIFDDGPYRYRQYKASAGMLSIDKLLNSELDIAVLGSTPTATAVTRSAELTYIGLIAISAGGEALVAKPGINNVQDLIGKKIGLACGSTSHYMLGYFLEQTGIAIEKVKLICNSPVELVALWDENKIDAIATWNQFKDHALATGGKRIMDSSTTSMWGKDVFDIWAVRNDCKLNLFLQFICTKEMY